MYQNQNLRKCSVILTIVLVIVFASGIEAKIYTQGPEVEDIYNNIRYAAPQYEWEESIVTFENEGMTVVCTLTIPKTPQRSPIVITLNGFFGPRDEEPIPGSDDTVFGRQCRVLAEHGIASLRVDFRGLGDSDGEFNIMSFSTEISDTLAAINFICSKLEHQVNSKRIGLLGFSQGGIIGCAVAAKDDRVDSLALWSAPAFPPHDYEGLLTKEGIKTGVALAAGESAVLPLYFEGQYLGIDLDLGKEFFDDLFNVAPLSEVSKYKGPMMYVAGSTDAIVWPQPAIGNTFLKYHNGYEKLITINADHEFDYWDGPEAEKLSDAIYWTTSWFIKTLTQ